MIRPGIDGRCVALCSPLGRIYRIKPSWPGSSRYQSFRTTKTNSGYGLRAFPSHSTSAMESLAGSVLSVSVRAYRTDGSGVAPAHCARAFTPLDTESRVQLPVPPVLRQNEQTNQPTSEPANHALPSAREPAAEGFVPTRKNFK